MDSECDAASLAKALLNTPLAPSYGTQEQESGPNPYDREPNARDAEPERDLRRVLHVINGEHYSGSERVQDLLASRLPDYGYEVGFACIKRGRFGEARQFQPAVIHEISMNSRIDLRTVGRICEVVKTHNYRLIHAHTPRSVMIGKLVSARCHLPLVYHVHSPTSRDSTRFWINRINAITERLSLVGAARLITVSESLQRHMLRSGYDASRLRVVPNGVPCVDPVPSHRAPGEPWTLGTIALFRPRKGTEVLLDALAILRDRGIHAKLRAVGGFETRDYERALRQRASELRLESQVDWVGFRRDVNAELEHMDLFVLPSLFGEGLPMVVLESMAMGIPVIGTDVEGVPEAIRDGIEGRIAHAGDPEHLAGTIASVIAGEFSWNGMREAAITRQSSHFSDHNMARRVAAVYDEVLPPKPLAPVTVPNAEPALSV